MSKQATHPDLLQGILDTLSLPDTRLPVAWAVENIYIPHSERQPGPYDPTYAPWLNVPINSIADPRVWATSVCGSVQGAKTQMFDIVIGWALANAPGPAIFTGQTDVDGELITIDKILPTLRASKGTKDIVARLPQDALSKTRLALPGMPMDIQGPSGNKIQSKSRRYLFNDEFWKYKRGMFGQLLKRSDASTLRKVISASQAGEEIVTESGAVAWDDWGEHWHGGTQEHYSIPCPPCGEFFCPETTDFVWDETPETRNPETKRWNWAKLKPTVRLKCPHCKVEHHPGKTTDERQAFVRKLANLGKYIARNPDAFEGDLIHRSHRWPVWVVWWKDWGDMVEEFLKAIDRLKLGIVDDLKNWTQQREAKFWKMETTNEHVSSDRKVFNYLTTKFKDGSFPEGVKERLLGADVQGNRLEFIIRDFWLGGDSQLAYEGVVEGWPELAQIAGRYRLKPGRVLVDCGEWQNEVFRECAARKWLGITGNGNKAGLWNHKEREKTILKPWSPWRVGRFSPRRNATNQGGRKAEVCQAHYIQISDVYFEDWLSSLIAGEGCKWEYPDDVSESYIKSLNSVRRTVGAEGRPKYVTIGKAKNHRRDAEKYVLAAACGIFGIFENVPEANGDTDEPQERKERKEPDLIDAVA